MVYAYQWLTAIEKSNITSMESYYTETKIEMRISTRNPVNMFTIEYVKDFEGFTSVLCKTIPTSKKISEIEKYFVDVFCEDLRLLVMNQKLRLRFFTFEYGKQDTYDPAVMDAIVAKIFVNLPIYLESRGSPFRAQHIEFSLNTVSEGISVVRFLDQWELERIYFSFHERNDPLEMNDFLLLGEWHDGLLLALVLDIHEMTADHLKIISTLSLLPKKFSKIVVFFKSCKEDNLAALFNPEFVEAKIYLSEQSSSIGLYPINPDIDWDEVVQEKESRHLVRRGSITEGLALEVLENSVVMENILANLHFFDIERLQKVCRGVRNCISRIGPDPYIMAYKIFLSVHSRTTIELKNEENRLTHYESWARLLIDFGFNLMHQKTCLRELELLFECIVVNAADKIYDELNRKSVEFLFALEVVLQSRRHVLKVQTFSIGVMTQDEVMLVLPHIDKESLEHIKILYPMRQVDLFMRPYCELVLKVDEMSKTEQWKLAKQLSIEFTSVETPIPEMNITHFVNLDILVRTISSGDISYLKTELLKSSTIEKFKFSFRNSTFEETLHTVIGEPYRVIPNVKKIWYFRMVDPDYYLHIVLETHNLLDYYDKPKPLSIVFTKVEKEDTPFF